MSMLSASQSGVLSYPQFIWSSYWHKNWSGSADWKASTANPLFQQISKDSASSSSATNIAPAKPANTAAAVLIKDG